MRSDVDLVDRECVIDDICVIDHREDDKFSLVKWEWGFSITKFLRLLMLDKETNSTDRIDRSQWIIMSKKFLFRSCLRLLLIALNVWISATAKIQGSILFKRKPVLYKLLDQPNGGNF